MRSERRLLPGPAGRIEVVLDWPDGGTAVGIAHVAHPHPLYGGRLDNKVVATLSRAFCSLGWLTVRFNFRGVGASEGQHDEGRGELDDLMHLVSLVPQLPEVAQASASEGPVALAGFSFGSFVAARAAARLRELGKPARHLVLAGAAAGKWDMPAVPSDALVVHGELDDVIPLADVLQWARGCEVPVVVIPAGEHFFHRRLPLLKQLVIRHLLGSEAQSGRGAPEDDSKSD